MHRRSLLPGARTVRVADRALGLLLLVGAVACGELPAVDPPGDAAPDDGLGSRPDAAPIDAATPSDGAMPIDAVIDDAARDTTSRDAARVGTDATVVPVHTSTTGLDDPLLFDPAFYLALYDDVRAAVGSDETAARHHWLTTGIYEGRRGSPAFDTGLYVALYPDVRARFAGDNAGAMRQFLTQGLPVDGRRGSFEFDTRYYLAHEADLAAHFGATGYLAAARHYVSDGLWAEGRRGALEFDVSYYVCHYADLARTFVGPNYRDAVTQWERDGVVEGRRSSADFDVGYYVHSYADITRVYGTHYRDALDNWLVDGRTEGRVAAPADGGGPRECPQIAVGGTYSAGNVPGMHDLAVAHNSTAFRAWGGHLYIHELGWLHTSEADRQAIVRMFPAAPIFETNLAQGPGSLRGNVLPYWPHGAWATCAQQASSGVPRTAAEITAFRAATAGLSQLAGAYYSPNDGRAYDTPFADRAWDDLRAAMIAGGVLCTDTPPFYYLRRPDAYRQFTADEISWAVAHGVVVVSALYPMDSVDEWSDAWATVRDLAARGALPTVWAVNLYYSFGNPNRLRHPLGSEAVVADAMYTALHLLEAYPIRP